MSQETEPARDPVQEWFNKDIPVIAFRVANLGYVIISMRQGGEVTMAIFTLSEVGA